MRIPTVHLNGTSGEALFEQVCEGMEVNMETTGRRADGERVLVVDHGVERPARVERYAPYFLRGQLITDGYYVQYLDATEQWHSHVGWQPAHALRDAPSADDGDVRS